MHTHLVYYEFSALSRDFIGILAEHRKKIRSQQRNKTFHLTSHTNTDNRSLAKHNPKLFVRLHWMNLPILPRPNHSVAPSELHLRKKVIHRENFAHALYISDSPPSRKWQTSNLFHAPEYLYHSLSSSTVRDNTFLSRNLSME